MRDDIAPSDLPGFVAHKRMRIAKVSSVLDQIEAFSGHTLDGTYQERIVVFVDILGWSDLVRESKGESKTFSKLAGVMLLLQQMVEVKGTNKAIKITQFSDCIVASVGAVDYPNLFSFLSNMALVSMGLGIVLRGGISRGKIIHHDNIVYGPALVEAYELESKHAIYPRIVFSQETSKHLQRASSRLLEATCFYSDDGFLCFNHLELGDIDDTDSEFKRRIMSIHRKTIEAAIEKHRANTKVLSKYLWLKTQYNNICEKYPELKIPPISNF